jgi:hypothetical protein
VQGSAVVLRQDAIHRVLDDAAKCHEYKERLDEAMRTVAQLEEQHFHLSTQTLMLLHVYGLTEDQLQVRR